MVYMLGLKTTHNKLDIKKFNLYSNKFEEIIKTLSKYICLHINEQHKSGSDIIQVFDSWAGLVPKKHIKNLNITPPLWYGIKLLFYFVFFHKYKMTHLMNHY